MRRAVAAGFGAITVLTGGLVFGGPRAVADEADTVTLGHVGELTNGDVVQEWTVSALKPSTDVIGHQVKGTLWEATATNEAIKGAVVPVISNFNARAANGDNYRVLFNVATSEGVNPATLAQGDTRTGKLYFDVTGANPSSVVYRDSNQDLITWAPAPQGSTDTNGSSPAAPVTAPRATPAPAAATPAAPATTAPATAAPASPAATPATTDSPKTPVSEGTPAGQGTPVAETPSASPGQGRPVSEGTPVGATSAAPGATDTGQTPATEGNQRTQSAPGATGNQAPTAGETTPVVGQPHGPAPAQADTIAGVGPASIGTPAR